MTLGSPQSKGDSNQVQVDEKTLDFVAFQTEKLLQLVQLADAKAQFVLGADTVLISILVMLLPDIREILGMGKVYITFIYGGLLAVFAVTTLISMTQAFLVIYPRYVPSSRERPHAPLSYFREVANLYGDAADYSQALQEASRQDLLLNAGAEIWGISVSADRKYTLVGLGTRWLIVSVCFWVIALVGTLLLLP